MTLVRTNLPYKNTLIDAMVQLKISLEHNKSRLGWLDRAISLAFNEADEVPFQQQRREVFYDIYQDKARFFATARLFAELWPENVCCCLLNSFKLFEEIHYIPEYAQACLEKQRKETKKIIEKPMKNTENMRKLLCCVGLAGLDQYVIQHISEYAHTPGVDYKYTPTSKTSYRALWTEGKWYREYHGKTGKRKRYLNERWSRYAPPLFV